MIDINWRPSRKELRVFSALLIVFCGIVATVIFRRTGSMTVPWIIGAAGLIVGGIGCIWPELARPVYLTWMVAAFPIGWTVSHLVLAAIYYLVFTPIGLLLRLTGRDAMKRRLDRTSTSYWEPRSGLRKPSDYFRQF